MLLRVCHLFVTCLAIVGLTQFCPCRPTKKRSESYRPKSRGCTVSQRGCGVPVSKSLGYPGRKVSEYRIRVSGPFGYRVSGYLPTRDLGPTMFRSSGRPLKRIPCFRYPITIESQSVVDAPNNLVKNTHANNNFLVPIV